MFPIINSALPYASLQNVTVLLHSYFTNMSIYDEHTHGLKLRSLSLLFPVISPQLQHIDRNWRLLGMESLESSSNFIVNCPEPALVRDGAVYKPNEINQSINQSYVNVGTWEKLIVFEWKGERIRTACKTDKPITDKFLLHLHTCFLSTWWHLVCLTFGSLRKRALKMSECTSPMGG